MARITYADKEQHHASPLPDEQKWMHGDANEVKDSVNAVYDADAAATGEVMFNDGTGVGKSPDLLFDGILQVGAISDVGQLQLGGATDTAVGTVSSNGTLTVEGQDINVSAGAVTTVSGVVGVAINGETIVAEATNGVDISAASGVRILTANQPRLAFDEDGAMLVSEDAGTAGQFIKSNGPGAAASWADILASGIANTPFFYLQSGSVTGTYREDGENGGRPKFSLITGNPALDLSAWSGTFWGVTIGGVLAYRSFDDVANPALCTTWEAVSGAAPLPTTSPLYGPTVQDALEQVAKIEEPILTGNTIWVDAVYGDDATGLANRQDKPFLTLTAAKDAATAGDLIEVRPGTYTDYDLLKNGVNWNFAAGSIIDAEITSTAGNETAIFYDNGEPVVCVITGALQAIVESNEEDALTNPVIRLSNPLSNVTISAFSLSATDVAFAAAARCIYMTEGSLTLVVSSMTTEGTVISEKYGGDLSVTVRTITGPFNGFQSEGGRDWVCVDYADIPEAVFYCAGGIGTPTSICRLGSNSLDAFGPAFYYNTGTLNIEATRVNGVVTSSGPDVVMDISIGHAESTLAMFTGDGGVQNISIISGVSASALVGSSVGTISVRCGSLVSMNTGPALEVVGGGTVRVSGRIELTTDNPMAANWDGTLIMDNATIVVGDMAASSFDAFSAKTLISYGSYSNKAVDGDVTVDGLLTVGAYVQ